VSEPSRVAAPGTPALPFSQRVSRGLLWNQVSRVVELAASYVSSIFVARALGAVEFGTYSIALSVVTLTYFSTSLGLNEILNVHVPRLAEWPRRVAYLLRGALRVRAGVALALALGLWLAAPAIDAGFHHTGLVPVLRAAALYVFFYNVSLLFEYFLVGSLQVPRVSRARVMVQVLNLGVAYAAMREHWHAPLLFLTMSATSALGLVWLAWGARAALRLPGQAFDLAPLRKFGLMLWATNFVNFFLGRQADILLIGYYRPHTDEAGCYSVASMLAMLCASALLMGTEGVSLAAFSELDQRVDRESLGRLWTLHVKADLLLSVPLLVLGATLAQSIIGVLYSSGYASAVPMLVAYAGVWVVARALGGGTNMTVLYAMNQPRLPLLIYGASGVFNLTANLVFVHWWGARGAILGTGLAMAGSSLVSGALVMRRTGARLPLGLVLKLALPALLVYAAVHWIPVHGMLGLVAAGVAGLAVYGVALRLVRPLDDTDRRLLSRLDRRLGWLASWV